MKITLKLYAMLSDYLPSGAQDHAAEIDVAEDISPHQLIDRLKIPREMAHLVLLNGVYLEPETRDHPTFKEGDTLAIWPPIAGGRGHRRLHNA